MPVGDVINQAADHPSSTSTWERSRLQTALRKWGGESKERTRNGKRYLLKATELLLTSKGTFNQGLLKRIYSAFTEGGGLMYVHGRDKSWKKTAATRETAWSQSEAIQSLPGMIYDRINKEDKGQIKMKSEMQRQKGGKKGTCCETHDVTLLILQQPHNAPNFILSCHYNFISSDLKSPRVILAVFNKTDVQKCCIHSLPYRRKKMWGSKPMPLWSGRRWIADVSWNWILTHRYSMSSFGCQRGLQARINFSFWTCVPS